MSLERLAENQKTRAHKALIVAFMGYVFARHLPIKPNGYQTKEDFDENNARFVVTGLTEDVCLDQMPYQSDLCLIMKVVEKFETMHYGQKPIKFTLNTDYVQFKLGQVPTEAFHKVQVEDGNKAKAVFIACIALITKYNANPVLFKTKQDETETSEPVQ